MQPWHRGNSGHVRLRAVARNFVLNLQIIEAFSLIESVSVLGTAALSVADQVGVSACTARRLQVTSIALLVVIFANIAIAVRIYKSFLLKEVFPAGIALLSVYILLTVAAERVILDVNLTVLAAGAVEPALDHANEAYQLRTLYLFWVEVVGFRYEEVADNIICRLRPQHVPVKHDVVIELLVALRLEVVDNRNLGRLVLDHELDGHGGHEGPTQRQGCQVDKLAVRIDKGIHLDF